VSLSKQRFFHISAASSIT